VTAERCSFCGIQPSPARQLVRGADDVSICRGCAELAVVLLDETAAELSPDVVLRRISTLVTMDLRRGGLLGTEHDVVVAVRRGRVVWVGEEPELPSSYRDLPALDCEGRLVMPGMVDAAAPLMGDPTAEQPEPVELTDVTAGRVRTMLARGVTSLDLRVGGGLEPTVETLLLAVARAVGDRMSAQVSVSWRCSPLLAPSVLEGVMAPTASRLAGFALVECRGDREQLERMLTGVHPMRPRLRCHEPEPDACLPSLASCATVEGSLPPSIDPGGPIPIVPWWEPGAAVAAWGTGRRPAIATFSDPGGRLLGGMGVPLMAAVDLAGLDMERALWSVTRGGSLALADSERGWIHLGGPADLVVVDGTDPSDLVRSPDVDLAWRVLVGGVEIV
jgi:hypothetical protein